MANCEHLKVVDPNVRPSGDGCAEVSRKRSALGAIAAMLGVRTRRLLRFLARPARQSTLQRDRTSGDAGLSIGRLEVVL